MRVRKAHRSKPGDFPDITLPVQSFRKEGLKSLVNLQAGRVLVEARDAGPALQAENADNTDNADNADNADNVDYADNTDNVDYANNTD